MARKNVKITNVQCLRKQLQFCKAKIVNDTYITFYEFVIKIKGKLIEGYAFLSYYPQEEFTITVSTILIPNEANSYLLGETDIVFISYFNSYNCKFISKEQLRSTQEIVFQNFKQNLTQHYTNLENIIAKLILSYSTENDLAYQNIVKSYSMLIRQLSMSKMLIRSYLGRFDKTIEYSVGIISIFAQPLVSGYCDSVSLHAEAADECEFIGFEYSTSTSIWGTFTSYVPYSGGNGVSFSGSALNSINPYSSLQGIVSVWTPSGSTIVYASARKTGGIGTISVKKLAI